MSIKKIFTAIGLVLALASSGQAVDLFDTVPAGNRGNLLSIDNATRRYAQSFSTTANDYIVDSVSLSLYLGLPNPLGTFGVEIYGFDTGNSIPTTLVPGGTVYSGDSLPLSTSATNVVFSGFNITLAPSTQYYIVLSASLNTSLYWEYTNNATGSGSTGYSSQFYTASLSSGSTWNLAAVTSTDPMIMKVTAVPEPSTYALAAIATGVMATVASRCKARKA